MSAPDYKPNRLPPELLDTALDLWQQSGAEHQIPVRGTSMLPLLREGDLVRVEHTTQELRRGDIVVFQSGGELITHRLLRVQPGGEGEFTLLTKGDNVIHPDPPVKQGQVVGRVRAVRRGEREMALDTGPWRWSNWLIGTLMLGWVRFYGFSQGAKQELSAGKSTAFSRVVRRGAMALSALMIKGLGALSGRWRS